MLEQSSWHTRTPSSGPTRRDSSIASLHRAKFRPRLHHARSSASQRPPAALPRRGDWPAAVPRYINSSASGQQSPRETSSAPTTTPTRTSLPIPPLSSILRPSIPSSNPTQNPLHFPGEAERSTTTATTTTATSHRAHGGNRFVLWTLSRRSQARKKEAFFWEPFLLLLFDRASKEVWPEKIGAFISNGSSSSFLASRENRDPENLFSLLD